ncbi:hypothetical protein [Occallatibacter riparius]|uniref:Uncharacterized protein n=1 Tax=Occallatibacter riparius TaxID=1002689 RepID=A0A9J7BHE5_9BACT|nr:hypothetical protein [Occallatibacter riparius]UWZ81835.1 hypothetical protein MOP44_14710 [Occallatibacter riparius]
MVAELIKRVAESGAVLIIEGGKLLGRPAERLAPFVAELKLHRAEVIAYLSRPKTAADEWAEDFTQWLTERCQVSDRFSTNLASLYRDFNRWCRDANDWPCDAPAFAKLLAETGFTIACIYGETLVHRLGLAEDVEFVRHVYGRGSAGRSAE